MDGLLAICRGVAEGEARKIGRGRDMVRISLTIKGNKKPVSVLGRRNDRITSLCIISLVPQD